MSRSAPITAWASENSACAPSRPATPRQDPMRLRIQRLGISAAANQTSMRIAMSTSSDTEPNSARINSGNSVMPPKKRNASAELSNWERSSSMPSSGHGAMTANDARQSASVREGPSIVSTRERRPWSAATTGPIGGGGGGIVPLTRHLAAQGRATSTAASRGRFQGSAATTASAARDRQQDSRSRRRG